MRSLILAGLCVCSFVVTRASRAEEPSGALTSIKLPPQGSFYHAVYPGGRTGEDNDIKPSDLNSYEHTVGKTAAWVELNNSWYSSRAFPAATATWVGKTGSVPYIRLMLLDSADQGKPNKIFTLSRIISGYFDKDFRAWAVAARQYAKPLIVEYGTEVNGNWFPWNGYWNGAGKKNGYGDPNYPDGPERFRDAYRHIITVMRQQGASNITWVFHVDSTDWPQEWWNRFEYYYPGDSYINWVGVSAYGAQTPLDEWCDAFRDLMDAAYPRMRTMAPAKPLALLEFGVTSRNPLCDQAQWAKSALVDLTHPRYPRLIGFTWWNEKWPNDDDPAHDTDMRVQDNPELVAVFKSFVGNNKKVLGRVILGARNTHRENTTPVE